MEIENITIDPDLEKRFMLGTGYDYQVVTLV
jgi:hypothetical protein